MIFGKVDSVRAAGTILAHGQQVGGRKFKKGRMLSAADGAALAAAGIAEVVVARLEAGDVHEDQAAAQLAAAAAGAGLDVGPAFTGRCNLYAAADGLLVLDPEQICRTNGIDEALTIATLPPLTLVRQGQMVATVKVIPFAVPAAALASAIAAAGATVRGLSLAPLRALKVGLIQTRLPGTKEALLDKTAAVLADRLAALHGRLQAELRCAHDHAPLTAALGRLMETGVDLLLVTGASAIVDRGDVIPAALVQAGGEVEHLGMPVDPGNLLLLGRLGGRPLLGLPGCARSPKFNGLDLVLNRLAAGLPVTGTDVMRMGVGGLLADTASRPAPRARPRRERPAPPGRRVAALVLAGGRSSRMGSSNKLLADVGGVPMVASAVDAALASMADPVLVVTGYQADCVRRALAERAVTFVHNPGFAQGLSSSLACGLRALPENVEGVLVCLGDMPRVGPQLLNSLIGAFDPLEGRVICLPSYRGKRGNPVLWARRFFPEMLAIKGDVGARHLIGEYAELVWEVAAADDGVLRDVDSPAALEALLSSL